VDPRQGVGLDLICQEDLGDSVEVNQRFVRSVHRVPPLSFCGRRFRRTAACFISHEGDRWYPTARHPRG
jgi:hypothetical protein